MSTSEPSTKPNEPYSVTERLEEAGSEIELAGGLTVRAVEVGAAVLIGLLVCPPLFILVVVVVVPLVALAVLVSLVGAVLATPYLIVRHLRGHRTSHVVLRQRLARAFHALLDIAPHRLLAAIRRSHPAG
jgi:multidrug efflux pump subunit AcrB